MVERTLDANSQVELDLKPGEVYKVNQVTVVQNKSHVRIMVNYFDEYVLHGLELDELDTLIEPINTTVYLKNTSKHIIGKVELVNKG